MRFTYYGYLELLNLLTDNGYIIANYETWKDIPNGSKCVILRHDIDTDVEKATRIARIEADNNVRSTYFVLVATDFYNIFSKRTAGFLKEIVSLGHDVGLHFDEERYPEIAGSVPGIIEKIKQEAHILEQVLEKRVESFSMHRPSREILDADISISGLENSYGSTYFKEFKYLSDSRKRWREPVKDIIAGGAYQRLHILTHPFWYDDEELSLRESIIKFIQSGNDARCTFLRENITDLDGIIGKDYLPGESDDRNC